MQTLSPTPEQKRAYLLPLRLATAIVEQPPLLCEIASGDRLHILIGHEFHPGPLSAPSLI